MLYLMKGFAEQCSMCTFKEKNSAEWTVYIDGILCQSRLMSMVLSQYFIIVFPSATKSI